jgi:hypothetical protein
MHGIADKKYLEGTRFLKNCDFPKAQAFFETALTLCTDAGLRHKILVCLDQILLVTDNEDLSNKNMEFERSLAFTGDNRSQIFIKSALNAHLYKLASIRLKLLAKSIPSRELLDYQITAYIGLKSTQAAMELLNNSRDLVSVKDALIYRLRILMSDSRYTEALSLIEACTFEHTSMEIVRSKYRALIGMGQFKEVAHDLEILREFFVKETWIVYELARNADAAKWRELACDLWTEVIESGEASDHEILSCLDALIENLDIQKAKNLAANIDVNLNEATKCQIHGKVLKAEGNFTKALNILKSSIKNKKNELRVDQRAIILSKISEIEITLYSIKSDQAYMDAHLVSAHDAFKLQPYNFAIATEYIQALIRCNHHDKARALIADLPANNSPRKLQLEMWKLDSEGNNSEAKDVWVQRTLLHFIPQIHSSPNFPLNRIDENDIRKGRGVNLYTVIRDELRRLPWFLKYYRNIGIEHFVFVDNGSLDGSVEYLLKQADVSLYSTSDSYVASFAGMVWVNKLKNELSKTGWAMYVDVDEAFVFDNIEKHSVNDLIEVLEVEGAEAITAFMLDMFSNMQSETLTIKKSVDFVANYPLFNSRHTVNPAPVSPYKNTRGGARSLLGVGEELGKTPLIKSGCNINFMRSSHNISPGIISEHQAALLHYKLVHGFTEECEAVITEKQRSGHCQLRYLSYLNNLNDQDNIKKILKNSETYSESSDLLDLGLISNINFLRT